MTKIEIIGRSLRCFEFGLASLIPVIGIPMALISSAEYRRVKHGQGEMWNPAQRYLFWGGVCARMSLAFFLVIPAIVIALGIMWNVF